MFKQWQLKAIRAGIGWSQGQLANKAGLTQPSISGLESGDLQNPGIETIRAIETACASEGFFFTENGIERKEASTFTIEGDDCYVQLLKLAESKLGQDDFFLKSGADERRSTDQVIDQLEAMRCKGIQMQSLIRPDDTFVMGDVDEYRWMNELVYVGGDVKLIFADYVAYLVTWSNPPKVIVVHDKIIASEARRTFRYLWIKSERPNCSTAPRRFSGVTDG